VQRANAAMRTRTELSGRLGGCTRAYLAVMTTVFDTVPVNQLEAILVPGCCQVQAGPGRSVTRMA
jgi:hypothetical protein